MPVASQIKAPPAVQSKLAKLGLTTRLELAAAVAGRRAPTG